MSDITSVPLSCDAIDRVLDILRNVIGSEDESTLHTIESLMEEIRTTNTNLHQIALDWNVKYNELDVDVKSLQDEIVELLEDIGQLKDDRRDLNREVNYLHDELQHSNTYYD